MAGAEALGGFVSLDAAGELRDRVLAARALQARAGAAARRAAGRGRARHRRRRRDRPRDRRRAARRGRLRRRLRPRPGGRRARRWRSSATTGSRSAATSRARTSVRAAFAAAVERFGGVDIVVSNAGVASSAALEETSLDEWRRNHEILVTGYFLVAREAFTVLKRQGRGGSVVFVASKNALVAGKNAAAYSSAKAAELHLARCLAEEGGGGRDPRQHGQPRRGPPGLADLGLVVARGARRRVRDRARRARGALPQPDHARRQHPARRTSPRRCCTSPRRRGPGKSTGNLLNVDGGVPAAYPR